MINRVEKIFFVVIICFVAITAIFWRDAKQLIQGNNRTTTDKSFKEGRNKKANKPEASSANGVPTPGITILKKWELPQELTEISAISYLDDQRFACIQDEEGSIYIYNISTNKIERKIPFGDVGDYEGMALIKDVAYVVNSSGVIYEINNLQSSKPAVKIFKTFLNAKNDVEGIGWDEERKKLLVTVKKDNGHGFKRIYAFDPNTKQMLKEPAITLDLSNSIFLQGGKKKKTDFQPSSISIHKTSGHIYVLEGSNQRLLILDNKGNPQKLVQFDKKLFMQPEGITFSPGGDVFISNEGKTGSGNILKVAMQ